MKLQCTILPANYAMSSIVLCQDLFAIGLRSFSMKFATYTQRTSSLSDFDPPSRDFSPRPETRPLIPIIKVPCSEAKRHRTAVKLDICAGRRPGFAADEPATSLE